MATLPFALSVHHIISSVGADVGFASLIGLALLVLLFFSQARETATLRSRADEAGLRILELEAELAELNEQVAAMPAEISVRAASPRAAAAFGAQQPGVPVVAGAHGASLLPPAAPAGVGAPALAAATRLIPDPVAPLPQYEPATVAGNGNGSPRPVVAASAATMQRPVPAPAPGATRPGPPPRVVGAPGGGGRPARGPGAGQGRQGRPSGGGPQRPGGPSRPSGAPTRPPARRSRGRMVFGGLLAVVALAAVVVAVIALAGGNGASSASHSSSSSATLAGHRTQSTVAAVQPATVTVSVLNGTDMQGLAERVSQRLISDGYRKGAVTNASNQTQTSSVVAYMAPGYRRDALAVATALKLGQTSVQQIDANTKAIACPPSQACPSAVVVTVGTDLAQQ
ncbi:MAG: LytR C-terminal domain-containing protein [Solirubrobacterales bacterium]|nr:LytR C-terminal domain-containing protein [Solirubrobacterales bacterium]